MDADYILSGSDDTNVRLWRAVANQRGTALLDREKKKREYQEAVVDKFKYMPEVKRIKNHTHVPKGVMKAARVKETVRGTQKQREKNTRAHSKVGTVPKTKREKKHVWKVQT